MPVKRSFYFIRHGQTDWNKEARLQGSTDIPLNAAGRQQALAASQAVKHLPIDLIITSKLSRAKETAEIINLTLKKPLFVDARISERDYGVFEGLTTDERELVKEQALKENPHCLEETGYPVPENSEPYAVFKTRVFQSINDHLTTHENKNILFVAHTAVYKTIYRTIFQDSMQPKNAAPYIFEKTEGLWSLKKI